MLSCYSLPVRMEEYKKLCICEQRASGGGGAVVVVVANTDQLTSLLRLKLKTSYWLKLVFYAFIIQTFNSRHDLLLND